MTNQPQRAQALFLAALELPDSAARQEYLDRQCAGDLPLRQRVAALLSAHDATGGFGADASGPELSATRNASCDARPGMLLAGRYKLLEAIGEGGMGSVWVAEQKEPVKRKVAIKLVKAGMDSKSVLARFEAERQALAMMDHPNIAKVFDGGMTEHGRPYFVMEYVKGVSLTDYCDQARLSLRERLNLFIPICQAVQHAHQKGIIHRDLKPSNILICLYDGRPVPKVIDFGLAKAMHQSLTEQSLYTAHGMMVGTPLYMSPEQAEHNNLDVDTRTDIYSLGVILYELLTGSTPLERRQLKDAAVNEILRLIKEVEPPKPSTRLSGSASLPSIAAQRSIDPHHLRKSLTGDLDWIVMKALDKERSRRYETANGLARDVERFLNDEAVEATPPTTGYRLKKFARKHRAFLTTAAVFAILLIVGTAISAWQAIRATKAEGVAQTERSKAEHFAQTEAEAHGLAVKQTQLANERADDLARQLYVHRVNLAYRETEANNVAQADALLAACGPDRRGWEWRFNKRLSHLETMTFGGFADHSSAVAGARRGPSAPPSTMDSAAAAAARELMGDQGNVRGVALSPDGKLVAAAHDDGTIGLYDAKTGREIRSLVGHDGCASCVTFDTDGGRVISGGLEGTIRVWDSKTGEVKCVLRGHSRPIVSIAFRPGSDELASCEWGAWETFSTEGFEIKQWNLTDGHEIRTLHHGHGWAHASVAFSSDGTRLLSTSVWGALLHIWDADSGNELEVRRISENCRGLAVSPTEGRLAFGVSNNLWVGSPDLRADMRAFKGHTADILGVAFSRDGTKVATAAEDSTIRVWEVATGRVIKLLRGHTGSVNSIAFLPNGNSLISCSADGTIKSWDLPLASEPLPFKSQDWAFRVKFSPDGRQTAVVRFLSTNAIDSTSAQVIREAPPGFLSYSQDGKFVATAANDSDKVNVLDTQTWEPIASSSGTDGHPVNICFGSGNVLAFSTHDGTVRFWEVPTGQVKPFIRAGEAGAVGLKFDPDGTVLATIGLDCAVRLWNTTTGELIRPLGVASGRMGNWATDGLAFSPNGRHLAALRGDATVAVWETATGAEVFRLRGHTRAITAVAYSPDGSRIATASQDFTIKLWDATNGDEVLTLRGHTGFVLGMDFSPDGNRLLSASADGSVRVWDATPDSNDLPENRLAATRDRLLKAIEDGKKSLTANHQFPSYRKFLAMHYNAILKTAATLDDSMLALETRRGLAQLAASDPESSALDLRLNAVLGGEPAKDAEELVALGERAYYLQRFALASRWFGEALDRDLAIADDRQLQPAYNAACVSVLAGTGQGFDDPPPDGMKREKLRKQALAWLQAELERWAKFLESATTEQRLFVIQTLSHWQIDADLAGIREYTELEKLPESERMMFKKLWAEVAALLAKALSPAPARATSP